MSVNGLIVPSACSCEPLNARCRNETHPEQDPGVKPPVGQEGQVEVDEEEGVDAQPDQLEQRGHVQNTPVPHTKTSDLTPTLAPKTTLRRCRSSI